MTGSLGVTSAFLEQEKPRRCGAQVFGCCVEETAFGFYELLAYPVLQTNPESWSLGRSCSAVASSMPDAAYANLFDGHNTNVRLILLFDDFREYVGMFQESSASA